MRAFLQLYLATVREFRRDFTALFWTLAFPVMFIIIFGIIFSGGEDISFDIGLVNEDGAGGESLLAAFREIEAFDTHTGDRAEELDALEQGDRAAVIVIPAGTGAALEDGIAGLGQDAPAGGGRALEGQALLDVYYDPADTNTAQIVLNIVDKVIGGMNEQITGVPPVLAYESRTVKSSDLRSIDYLLPGVLAMSLMQLGLFGTAAPLVSLREKGVLRRMGVTPLPRSALLASQVAFRLTTAVIQTGLIVVIGAILFDVHIEAANALMIAAMVALGATLFITMGYFIAGMSRTEEAVQGIISLPNFIFMFLSGIFFPVEFMPSWIRPLVDVIPLTYLGDALRHTMIGAGTSFSLGRDVLVLGIWLAACTVLALRFFKWEPQA